MPNLDITAKEIFTLCASEFRDEALRANLCAYSSRVDSDSSLFKDSFPNSALQIDCDPELPEGITKDKIIDVYETKFARKKSIGRKYYDSILKQYKSKKCPICGFGHVRELDHYMPKSHYYTLVVTPENLIPICRDCNREKDSTFERELEKMHLHPYFDGKVCEKRWLSANLQTGGVVSYYVDCPVDWSDVLKYRVKNHFVGYCLDARYPIEASQEIAFNRSYWFELLHEENGQCVLLEHLKTQTMSIEKNGLNTWRAAMYRALVSQFSKVVEWIEEGVQDSV